MPAAPSRSDFILKAAEEDLKALRRRELEAELAAACEANAEFGRQVCEEFSYVDSENF